MIYQDDVVMHYGVRGMRWGVRKAPGTSAAPSATRGKSGKPKAKAKASSSGSGLGNAKASVVRTAKALPYKTIGKNVALAVVATAGAIGAASVAGPVAGAAVGAALRGIGMGVTTTSRDYGQYPKGARPTTSDGKVWDINPKKLDEEGREQVNKLFREGATIRIPDHKWNDN